MDALNIMNLARELFFQAIEDASGDADEAQAVLATAAAMSVDYRDGIMADPRTAPALILAITNAVADIDVGIAAERRQKRSTARRRQRAAAKAAADAVGADHG